MTKTPQKKKNGKTRKPSSRMVLVVDAIVIVSVVLSVAAGLWLSSGRNRSGLECGQPATRHQVELVEDSFKPASLSLRRCDVIITSNRGVNTYELVFGTHENLIAYPGFGQQRLRPGEYFELQAVKAGDYVLHDHIANKAHLELRIVD